MKWYITRRRMLWVIIVLLSVLALFLAFGCTAREEANAKKAGGVAVGLFGLPPIVGESLVALVLAASHAVTGKVCHGRGRRKERSCHIPKAPTP